MENKNEKSYIVEYDETNEEIRIENQDSVIHIKNRFIDLKQETPEEKLSIKNFNNSKIFKLTKRLDKNSSILLELVEDKEGNIKKCNIDFRTHKGNNKINGTYLLRISKGYYPISLKSVDRHGYQTADFSELLNIDSETKEKIKQGNITSEIIEYIIRITIAVINVMSLKIGRKQIPNKYDMIDIEKLRNRKLDTLNYIDYIKEDTPIDKIKLIIEETEQNYQNNPKLTKVKKKL